MLQGIREVMHLKAHCTGTVSFLSSFLQLMVMEGTPYGKTCEPFLVKGCYESTESLAT
jgi:hypothetical protein